MRLRPTRRTIRLLLALVPVLLAGAPLAWWRGVRRSALPERAGVFAVASLDGEATVRFDDRGVPHVTAASERDLATALGWLHANDRLAQMELLRRRVAGRLAEVLGKRALALDLDARRLGMRTAAEGHVAALDPESLALAEAYCDGVNAWLDGRRRRELPPLFRVLKIDPEPWTPADCMSVPMVMARGLSFPTGHPEERRLTWLGALGPARTQELVGGPPLAIDPEVLERARALAPSPGSAPPPAAATAEPFAGGGSNNWALGASRTDTGAPLVANDPHLFLMAPGIWYAAHLDSPDVRLAGLTIPGTPGVLIGHNGRVAWSFTNARLDDSDIFLEELDDEGTRVRRGDAWEPLEARVETVRVRAGKDRDVLVRHSEHGPLLPADTARGLPPRSIAWTALRPADPMRSFRLLARAETVDDALAAAALQPFLAQNMVTADKAGGLAFTVAGRRPDRRGTDGRLPAPAWRPGVGWAGLLPHAANPLVVRPAADLLITANEDVRPPGYDDHYGDMFDTDHRARRIRELLESRGAWTAADAAAAQGDIVSLYAHELVPLLGCDAGAEAARALALLQSWDGTMEGGAAPLLFAHVERALFEDLLGDDLAAAGLAPLPLLDRRPALLRLLRGELSPAWFDDARTPREEDRDEALVAALDRGWREATALHGEEPRNWDFDAHHKLTLAHPLGSLPLIGGWFDRGPVRVPGSDTTVAASGGPMEDGELRVAWGASARVVFDLADPDRSRLCLPLGQSGHPSDAHYDDQLDDYVAGRSRTLAWSAAAVEAACASTLRLVPAVPPRT